MSYAPRPWGAVLLPDGQCQVRRRHPEEDIQKAVIQYLGWALPPNGIAYAIPNGGLRHKKAAARLKGQGVTAGIPDIHCLVDGRSIYIELKAARGVVSPAQRLMMQRLYYCGAEVVVCRGVPEVQAALQSLGVPLRAAVAA